MNIRNDHPNELLPWYVNGTLADGERLDVETHLQSCERCRQEVTWLRNLRAHIKADTADSPGGFGLNRLMHDIGTQKLMRRPGQRWWRPALAVAAVIIAVQFAVLINFLPRPASITPLGGPAEEGVVLQVKFAPNATEAQIRQLLQQTQATLIGGPGALGIYRLRLEGVTITQNQTIRHILDLLTAQTTVVTYAERE